jgi:hypothetical protein
MLCRASNLALVSSHLVELWQGTTVVFYSSSDINIPRTFS